MADQIFNTRIQLKYDTWENWQKTTEAGKGANYVLLKGEIGICAVKPAVSGTDSANVSETTPPQILIKIGDGEKTFSALPWISAKAADVASWAKEANKPTYSAEEITGMGDFIAEYVDETLGISVDTDTQYRLNKVDDYTYKLQSKAKGEADTAFVDVSTITIPKYDDSEIREALNKKVETNTVTSVQSSGDYINVSSDNAANPTYTVSLNETATRALISEVAAVGVDYLGTISDLEELDTTVSKGDFYRADTAFGDVHVGDVIIAEKDNPVQEIDGINWTVIHCHVDTDTNTVTSVTKGTDNVTVTETKNGDNVDYTISVDGYTKTETDTKVDAKLDKSGNGYGAEWTESGLKIDDGDDSFVEISPLDDGFALNYNANGTTGYFMFDIADGEDGAYVATQDYVDASVNNLSDVAKSGDIKDLTQTKGHVIIFNCGDSTTA